jgi:hypothetical protein
MFGRMYRLYRYSIYRPDGPRGAALSEMPQRGRNKYDKPHNELHRYYYDFKANKTKGNFKENSLL